MNHCDSLNPTNGRDFVNTPKSHPRKWVECSDPTYRGRASRSENPTNGSWWMVQIQPVRSVGSQMKRNSLMYPLSRLVSEARSEQSTNFRWWNSRIRSGPLSRLDLKNPPTSVGGIF